MLLFHNDYNEMCHPKVMEKVLAHQNEQMDGYGTDSHCRAAADRIRALCGDNDLDVHFLVGGTQTNLTVIDAALRPHQGAIGPETAHINAHETGAVEATGHKVLQLPGVNGKITAKQVENAVLAHRADESFEHIVQPKLVYISDSTELGTIYYLDELQALYNVCRKYGLYLFVDGARLGYAMAAEDNDITLADMARLTDAFYIGGTKVGAMFGEAVVISNPAIKEDFRYLIKQHGGMLAKGWLLGLQFEALLEDDLYFKVSKHAVAMAEKIRETLKGLGYTFYVENTTNQVFPILPDSLLEKLKKEFTFCEQIRVDDTHRAVRFCTSWATKEENVFALCKKLELLTKG